MHEGDKVCVVWIEHLDTAILAESVGARLKRRKLDTSVVPASSVPASSVSDSVLHASDAPESAGSPGREEDPIILVSPFRQGALSDLGLFNCHDPTSAPYVVPHHSQLSLKGSKLGPNSAAVARGSQSADYCQWFIW